MERVIAHMENFLLKNFFSKVTIQYTLYFLTRKCLKTADQSEYIIGPGGHFDIGIGTNFLTLVKDHLPKISAKLG